MRRAVRIAGSSLVALTVFGAYRVTYGCPPNGGVGTSKHESLTVFYASSLRGVMRDLTAEFKKAYQHLEVHEEAGGSREMAYAVAHLKRTADLIFVADPLVIQNLLMPEHADWYVAFGGNPLVIAYTERSRYGDEITKDNWHAILARKDVRIGRANEHLSPLGYRTLMAWQLADRHYHLPPDAKSISATLQAKCPPGQVLPSEMELLQPLQSYDFDYVFEYRSIARSQHLKYVELPDEVNLGNPSLADWYAQAQVTVSGKTRGTTETLSGSPITYGFAFLKDPAHQCDWKPEQAGRKPSLASQCLTHDCYLSNSEWVCILDFVRVLFSDRGQEILERNGFTYTPPIASDVTRLPVELRSIVERAPSGQPPSILSPDVESGQTSRPKS
jgi:molybdate/tungstate transport system substrate-binding protein